MGGSWVAAAAAVEQWLMANNWAGAGTIAGLVSDRDAISERHFPAYRAGRATFQGQGRLRLRDFLPCVGIDPSGWPDERLDDIFKTYLVAYEAVRRSFPNAEPCLGAWPSPIPELLSWPAVVSECQLARRSTSETSSKPTHLLPPPRGCTGSGSTARAKLSRGVPRPSTT